jgi:spore coat polysaccharide biosynthesis predicted glycosyltransferase SpsG
MRSQKKTILVKAAASPRIGTGHVYRSLSLAKELKDEFNILFHTNNIPQVKALVQEQGVRYFVNESVANVVEGRKVDLLLFDQLGDDEGLFEKLKVRFPRLKIVALDYFNYDNGFVSAIINLFNHNPEKPKPDKDSIQYYEGLEYAIIREELQDYTSRAKKIPQKARNTLVTFGGVDSKGNTGRALQLLGMAGLSDVKVEVILGPLWGGKPLEASAPNIHFYHSIPSSSMANFMAEADLAFCGAGTTMLELLSLGTPTVVLPQNDLEERFAISVEQRGVIKVIKDNSHQENISYICNLFTSPEERKRLSQGGKSLVDGEGKKRIHKIIHQLLSAEEKPWAKP